MTSGQQEQIRIILKDYDFKKVKKLMDTVGWKYNNLSPTIDVLKSVAEHCLMEATKGSPFKLDNSGFEADCINNTLELRFTLTHVEIGNTLSNLFS